MTRYREHNNLITPAVPCLFVYDITGGQSFNATGAYHTWDTIKIKTSGFHFSADDNRFTLLTNTSGLFNLEFDCSFYTLDSDDDLYLTTGIYKNGTVLSGSVSVIGITGAASQAVKVRNSQSIHYIVYLERDDYIQVKTTASANAGISIANSSRLLINFLPMHGYDNGKAGRLQFKGEIMR